jgi:hypothetical protein
MLKKTIENNCLILVKHQSPNFVVGYKVGAWATSPIGNLSCSNEWLLRNTC